MSFLDSLIPSDWICAVHRSGAAFLANTFTKEKKVLLSQGFNNFQQFVKLQYFVWNNENEKLYIIGEEIKMSGVKYINIYDFTGCVTVYFLKAENVTFSEDGKSFLYTSESGEVTKHWFNYTDKDINEETCKQDQYHFHLHTAKSLRAFLDSGHCIGDLVKINEKGYDRDRLVTRMELAVVNNDISSIRVLLLKGIHPILDSDYKKNLFPADARFSMVNSYSLARESCDNEKIIEEMEAWMRNKKAYEHKHSALIPFVIGTASLDLPALISTIVAEYLIWVNDDRIAQFSETKSWNIAALVKQKYHEINT